jgi:hypothetical protein
MIDDDDDYGALSGMSGRGNPSTREKSQKTKIFIVTAVQTSNLT